MVARLTFPKRLEAALNYNEQKLQKSKAVCLAAAGYLKEPEGMNFYEKLQGLSRLASLNERAGTKTLHVSLNFDPSEKLPDDKLRKVAAAYMKGIGFGSQPFLVYKHTDAGHPHIHIVSTTIRQDGTRINTHNLGRNQSEGARKEIEKTFGLLPAGRQRQLKTSGATAGIPQKVLYGRHETKQAISNVVATVFHQYKFASLAEYNAALRQFNVVADRGREGSRIYNAGGLVYRVLDEEGNKVGVPIKASTISCRPTLKNLEQRFAQNGAAKAALIEPTKAAVDKALQTAGSLQELITGLQGQNIAAVLRQSEAGLLYGITFVDNNTKTVFNGSDLGKAYSAAGIQRRLIEDTEIKASKNAAEKVAQPAQRDNQRKALQNTPETSVPQKAGSQTVMEALLTPHEPHEIRSSGLLQKKRKKKPRKDIR